MVAVNVRPPAEKRQVNEKILKNNNQKTYIAHSKLHPMAFRRLNQSQDSAKSEEPRRSDTKTAYTQTASG